MREVPDKAGVPSYKIWELHERQSDYCLCIPVLNEGERVLNELSRAKKAGIDTLVDIIICDRDPGDAAGGIPEEKIIY